MSLPKTYAKALYQTALDQRSSSETFDLLGRELETLAAVVESAPDLKTVLYGPVANIQEKSGVLEAINKKLGLSKLLTQFVVLLARKGRLALLPEIKDAYALVRLTEEGGLHGELVAAEAIDQADVDGLAKAFSAKLGKKVSFKVSTDSELLAGMKVTVNGVTYDGTLRSQLSKLRDQFTASLAGNS